MNTAGFETAYRAYTDGEKIALWKKVLGDRKMEQVREFLVTERGPDPKARSFIIHLPSGLWRGFETCFPATVWMLRQNPGADTELLNLLFEI